MADDPERHEPPRIMTEPACSPDPIFDERRLAEIYDPLDPDRSDLDVARAKPGAGIGGVES